jgi:hypothetical protein
MLYGIHLAVLFYVIVVAREFFVMDVLSPGWVSVRLLAWFGAALSAGAAALMWLNVDGFAPALGEAAAWRMTAGAVATTVSTIVLLAIAVAHYSFGRRGSRVGAWLFFIAVIASMTLPIAARGPGAQPPADLESWAAGTGPAEPEAGEPRVALLLLDGASLEHIWPRAAEGRLPNFSRLLDGGAVLDLATIRPTQPDPVWAAVATGMYPAGNGVRSAARYFALGDARGIDLLPDHCLSHALVRLGFVTDRPESSSGWGARPVWDILAREGLTAGVVRWPLTHPAPPTRGFIVSDRLHLATNSIADFDRAAYPREALATVQAILAGSQPAPGGGAMPAAFSASGPEVAAMERDVFYGTVARALRFRQDPRFFALRYTGLDTVEHHYLRYAVPGGPRGVPEAERRRFSGILDSYYAFIDAEIGIVLDALAPGDLLLVAAGFGMQPLNPVKRLVARALGDPEYTGTHERAPDGFLLAFGTAVQPGRPQRASIVDLTPTLLYFFGLPVARDMDGFARSDLFTREFTAERPVTFIRSYR